MVAQRDLDLIRRDVRLSHGDGQRKRGNKVFPPADNGEVVGASVFIRTEGELGVGRKVDGGRENDTIEMAKAVSSTDDI